MGLRLVTAPTGEPVTREQAKAHLRVDTAYDDAMVDAQITAARQWVEEHTWRALISQEWELSLHRFPATPLGIAYWEPEYLPGMRCARREIYLPKGDVQSVASVKYDDEDGVEQTFSSSSYILDPFPPARIVLRSSADWPDVDEDGVNEVRIRFVAGYGNADAVPQPIKSAILLLVSQLYEHRTPEVTGTIVSPVQFSLHALLSPYRVIRL